MTESKEIRIGPADKDDAGNFIKSGVFIEINGKRCTFAGGNIRTLAKCIEKWADFAEGKTEEPPHPKGFIGDIFAPLYKCEQKRGARANGHPAAKAGHEYLDNEHWTSFGSFTIGLTEKHALEQPERCGKLAVRIGVGDQEIDMNPEAAEMIAEQLQAYAKMAREMS